MSPTIESAVELAITLEWGYVVIYFLHRWWKHRRLVSFGLAAMAAGWLVVGAFSPELGDHIAVKATALVLGLVLCHAIWRVERRPPTSS